MKIFHKLYDTYVLRIPQPDDEGQATAEYSLVIVGAAIIAGLLITWATGTGSINSLFNSVIGKVIKGIG